MNRHTEKSLGYTLAFSEGNDVHTRIMCRKAFVEVNVRLSGTFDWALRTLLITGKEVPKVEEREPKVHGRYP